MEMKEGKPFMKMQILKFALILLLSLPVALSAQGFGLISKKTVTINRPLPPTVNLNGKCIRVEATADAIQRDDETLRLL
jgi:hypothetical protein